MLELTYRFTGPKCMQSYLILSECFINVSYIMEEPKSELWRSPIMHNYLPKTRDSSVG